MSSSMSAQVLRRFGPAVQNEEDRGTIIRFPSTANFVVDSLDRVQYGTASSSDFIINKKNSLFNGFFTRFALTEIVLDWCLDNISAQTDNNTLTVTLAMVTHTITLDDGSYTTAEVIDSIVTQLNTAFGAATFRLEDKYGNVYNPASSSGPVYLATTAGTNFEIAPSGLQQQLNVVSNTAGSAFPITCPKLLPYYYLDFVSPQITYNQDLKDNSTSSTARDILYRWVFAWDGPAPLDKYGYPVFQGYKPFVARRSIAFPKQINWTPDIPLGQVAFQVYSQDGTILPVAGQGEMEFQMTFLVSEN